MYTEIPITTVSTENEKSVRHCSKCGKITDGNFEYGGIRLCKLCWFMKVVGPMKRSKSSEM